MKNDSKMKIFYEEANRLMSTSKTFKDIFDIQIQTWRENDIFIYEDENNKTTKIKYLEFGKIAKQYAYYFNNFLKHQKGSFIALKMNNSPKWIYTFWGLIIAGFNVLMINPITLKNDTNRLLKESNCKAIVKDNNEVYDVESINVDEIKLTKEYYPEVFAEKIAFCTSGTTGKSKIYVYNSINMAYQIYAAYCMPDTTNDIMYRKPNIRLITIVPFAHIFGFVAVLFWFSFFGRTFVFPKSINPDEITYKCKKYKVSHIFSVPLFWDRVAKSINQTLAKENSKKQKLFEKLIAFNNKEISRTEAGFAGTKLVKKIIQKKILGYNVVYCIAGGSTLSKGTLRMINGVGYPLYNGYGMTEIGITSVELSPDVIQRNKASVGKALTNVEYKINNGELLVKSPQMHSETLINGKLEKAIVDDEGYFHTGDIATIDENGYTFIRGKYKDVVIGPNGENIYPDEIETKFKDIDQIEDLTVLGIPSDKGEILTMIIYVGKKLSKEEILKIENEISEANEKLPISMQVQQFFLSTLPLPTNASMKIMKYQLVDDFKNRPETFIKITDGSLVSFEGFDENEINLVSQQVTEIISDILNIDKNDLAKSAHIILDLGGDSFTYMSVIASIESEFDIKIPTEMIGRLNSVNEFTLYILKTRKLA